MNKHILRISVLTLLVGAIIYFNGGLDKYINPETVKAFGDLVVDFHVALGNPIFNLNSMKPGDSISRTIDVTNSGDIARFVSLKGYRASGVGSAPFIESALMVEIKDGTNLIYGPRTMANLFIDSATLNGIPLNLVGSGGHKTYNIFVDFPQSSGNQFQSKSVKIDLAFGVVIGNNIVINEVYYNVDSKSGVDSPKDLGDKKNGNNNEWVELYNPTNSDVSLKGWTLMDNSGISSTINSNKIIKAGSFLLVSKDASTWKFWNLKPAKDTLELGNQIGDGLDNSGDQVSLKNNSGVIVDQISWNTGTSSGHSLERLAPGYDTDINSDFVDKFPPTPGL